MPWTDPRRLARATAAIAAAFLLACTSLAQLDEHCPRGQQRVDGHCVPTPSLVFQRCMDAVRARTIEHDRGRELAVGARIDARSAQLQHERHDRQRQAYEGLGSEDLALALDECRRQEDAERQGQIARAWEEAARAQEQAERARIDAVAARGEAQRLGAALRRVEAVRGHDSDAPPTDAYASLPDPERQPLPAVSDDLDQSAPPSALVEPEPALAPTPAVEAPAPSETPVL